MRRTPVYLAILCATLLGAPTLAPQVFELPPQPKPSLYGNLLIDRLSKQSGEEAVGFSHWSHRTRHTCRVCHFELGFEMAVNTTEIICQGDRAGEFCGACHDGETAFANEPSTCKRCHSGSVRGPDRAFKDLRNLPRAPHGNKIDWVEAVRTLKIWPRQSILEEDYEPIAFDQSLTLEAEWSMISPAVFPHEAHGRWLDCANCHPDIFNVKKKTTKHFEMRYNLEGKFCGACHLKVAFPMDDCKRCHPKMNL
jgi:c(7)-type cytochrome triheme protein